MYSEALDHTSLIRVLETIFGVQCPNISAWRRETFGDMTGALQFQRDRGALPRRHPAAVAVARPHWSPRSRRSPQNPAPTVPTGAQTMPTQ